MVADRGQGGGWGRYALVNMLIGAETASGGMGGEGGGTCNGARGVEAVLAGEKPRNAAGAFGRGCGCVGKQVGMSDGGGSRAG